MATVGVKRLNGMEIKNRKISVIERRIVVREEFVCPFQTTGT